MAETATRCSLTEASPPWQPRTKETRPARGQSHKMAKGYMVTVKESGETRAPQEPQAATPQRYRLWSRRLREAQPRGGRQAA